MSKDTCSEFLNPQIFKAEQVNLARFFFYAITY